MYVCRWQHMCAPISRLISNKGNIRSARRKMLGARLFERASGALCMFFF